MPEPQEESTTELVRRLDDIEAELKNNIDTELSSARDIKNQVERLEETAMELETLLDNNENLYNDRKAEELLDSLRADIKSLDNKRDNLHTSRQKVESVQSKINNIRDALASVVEEELDSKIVKEFQSRRNELNTSLFWWKIWTGLSIGILFLTSGYIYWDISPSDTTGTIAISKILLLLPVLVFVWFSINQYNKHKILIEQYEFKTSMADSLMGFREVLRQDFPDDKQERVGEFVIDSVNTIYENPTNEIDDESTGIDDSNIPKSNADMIRKLLE